MTILYGGVHPISLNEALHLGGVVPDWSSDRSPLGTWNDRIISLARFLLEISYPQTVPKSISLHLASLGVPRDLEIAEIFLYGDYLVLRILGGQEECYIDESLNVIPGRIYPRGLQSYWVSDLQELTMPDGERWVVGNGLR